MGSVAGAAANAGAAPGAGAFAFAGATADTADHGLSGYGGFVIGALRLALPIAAMREVMPRSGIVPVPCTLPAIVGAVDLRGTLVPVLDLARLLGRDAAPAGDGAVLIVVHAGRLLGLAIDAVTGVFAAAPPGVAPIVPAPGTPALLAGSLRRADDGALLGLLSIEALLSLEGVPASVDPEPQRTAQADGDSSTVAETAAATPMAGNAHGAVADVAMMLFACGGATLAIDAAAVETTLPDPRPEPSPVAGGACLGMQRHGSRRLAAVDLAAVLGLGAAAPDTLRQAFVLTLETGAVACLISEVIDIKRTRRADELPLETFAMARPGLLRGVLPRAALGDDISRRLDANAHSLLVLDPASLVRDPTIAALAAVALDDSAVAGPASSMPATEAFFASMETESAVAARAREQAPGRPMITFVANRERATPLSQVLEILPWHAGLAVDQPGTTLLGLATSRGRAIPVLCLASLLGEPRPHYASDACVLVVGKDGAYTGFVVERLRSLETAAWEPRLPPPAHERGNALANAIRSGDHVLVVDDHGQRTLAVLDLERIATALRDGATPVAA